MTDQTLRLENVSPYLLLILDYFEKNCINKTDLFSIQGNQENVNRIISNIKNFTPTKQFEKDLNRGLYSRHDLSFSIINILNSLNHPLLLENYNEAYIVNAYYEDIERIKQTLLELPHSNLEIILKLFSTFNLLCNQEEHKSFLLLSPEMLGETFAFVLMRFKKTKDEVDQFGNKIFATNVISYLISHFNEIFDSTILDFEQKEKKSRENAILFMEYAMRKYTSLDNHFKSIYNKYIPHKRDLSQEDVQTIKTEFNLRKYSGKSKIRPPIPIYM
ncbi:hypothetical protein ACTFIW_006268 [Dictyostelium discoideum]|uniref:Rho GTPase-activating protein gacB n=1 Tax=Dictyostelium discoideum TaxID=44689 RepID=GACB_DICDI|nr:RhoGAP domain-containing protein [Dictyostelium discoideum AX4]Q54XW7.1 RecName: Full=Rho GTPase-activating protein gacB; AltName: Full=GTPase activating factor for raC protein B [Dictyostelium discoideum]EAL68447.1 RhoGAP domain-containing protein [Dictyostelium discoideum AX4]|eukprot:XP_642435.1 RhoGAP domain-containing protein [Dictyostelium discoideum AX4]